MTVRGNGVLARLLDELGWSPRGLARRINREFGRGAVAETAPYHWRDAGRVPRAPLPGMVAAVLSGEVGRRVTVEELWQGRAPETSAVTVASDGMALPWSTRGVLDAVDDWVVGGLLDRRTFLAVSGGSLSAVVAGYGPAGPSSVRPREDGSSLVRQIEQSIPMLQRLDDDRGGGGHLAYVGAQFRSVGLLIRGREHHGAEQTRLLAALTDIGQLAGWMAFDAGDHGLAQRYLFTALRAAKEARYDTMAAHIMADLAFQAATRENPRDAIDLGEAAQRIAAKAPASVAASVRTRSAYGYALIGDIGQFDVTYGAAREILNDTRPREDPPWMYYLTPNHLEAQAGHALIHSASLVRDDKASKRRLLRRGEALLRNGAYERPLGAPSQRRALFEGAWLAVAAATRGDLERSCAIGRVALDRTATVQSRRSLDVLSKLAVLLRRSQRNAYVADFLPVLEGALDQRYATP